MVIIYINFADLESLIDYTEFQDHETSNFKGEFLKVFGVYGHGGHLRHVTNIIFKIHVPKGGST